MPLLPHAAATGVAQSDAPCVSVIAPGSPGGATPGWNQDHVVAHSAVPNAPMDTSQEVDPASDDASEASEASVTTAFMLHVVEQLRVDQRVPSFSDRVASGLSQSTSRHQEVFHDCRGNFQGVTLHIPWRLRSGSGSSILTESRS